MISKVCKSLRTIDLYFLETDMAGIGIVTIYEAASRLLGADLQALKRTIFGNFAKVFAPDDATRWT